MQNVLRRSILAGAAAIAFTAAPVALAQGNGNANGNGNGNRGANSQAEQRGGGADNKTRGNGNGNGKGNGKANAGREDRGAKKPGNGNGANRPAGGRNDNAGNSNRGAGNRGNSNAGNNNRGNDNRGNDNRADNARGNAARGNASADAGRIRGGSDYRDDFAVTTLRRTFGDAPRVIDGCPPGLARKNNGCLPPGQARQRYRNYEPRFFGLIGADRGDYFYDDGYLLRYRPDGIAGFIPLLGGALGLGNVWPASYRADPLPDYFSRYYNLDDPRSYRYADNVIYRVDAETAAIQGTAALLTGSDIRIGSPMPRGYDVYNVPYAYRDRYSDRQDRNYRYADGHVYEIDTQTALVLSAIRLLD